MTDDEMLKLARKLKLPAVMCNSIGFRAALIRVYVAGQGEVAATVQTCSGYRSTGTGPLWICDRCGAHRDQHPGESP